ncbi:MAG: replication protein C, IncQ-type [Rhodobacteraceae bacterium]|nr:replication protein C, IncQ-type [Paracoccaceae bacterium]
MRQCSTEFAQIDPVLLEFDLFKSLPRDGTSSPLVSSRSFGGIDYRLTSSQTLDDLALKTLLVLCALAGSSAIAESPAMSQANSKLWDRLALSSGEPITCAIWQGSIGDILREAGMQSGGGNKDRISDRLGQLSEVRISFSDKSNKKMWQSNLISLSQNQKLGEIRVAFSPGLSARILRKQRVQYSHIWLDPIRTTASPAARILHAILSNRIRVGATARYSLEKLAEIVYHPSGNAADLRKRRSAVKTAIKELISAGWEFRQETSANREVFEIRNAVHDTSQPTTQANAMLLPGAQFLGHRVPAWRTKVDPRGSRGILQHRADLSALPSSQVPRSV